MEERATVLLVDDDTLVTAALGRALRHEDFHVLIASSGQAALELLASEHVDVLLCDHCMPGMSGTDLLARTRESYPATIRLLLTGHATLDVAIEAINRGEVFRILTKPCDPRIICHEISHALSVRELSYQSARLVELAKLQRGMLGDAAPDSSRINVEQLEGGAIDVEVDITDLVRSVRDVLGSGSPGSEK